MQLFQSQSSQPLGRMARLLQDSLTPQCPQLRSQHERSNLTFTRPDNLNDPGHLGQSFDALNAHRLQMCIALLM